MQHTGHAPRPAVAYVGIPLAAAIVIVLYWPSLSDPYRLDDFAWLSLGNTLKNGRSLWWALFSPQAQGTIRPFGDRVWFLLASFFFGLNSTPLHALALFGQVGNVIVMADTGRQLTGSWLAAVLGVVLWVVNVVLVQPMVWASAVNEVLYTFWFLLAFNLFLRSLRSSHRTLIVLQIAAVLMALGTLELAATLPLVFIVYALLFSERRWTRVAPATLVVIVYVILHLWAVPLPAQGPYKVSWGAGAAANLLLQWKTVLGPSEFGRTHGTNVALMQAATFAMTAAILCWAACSTRKRNFIPLFGLLWFVITLAPTLALSTHQASYYAFLPFVGLCWLGGDALVRTRSSYGKSLAASCALVYVAFQVPSVIVDRDWYHGFAGEMAAREKRTTTSIAHERQVQPAGPIFLTGLNWEDFWWGLCYGELTRSGFRDIHILSPENTSGLLVPSKEWCYTPDFQFSKEDTDRLLHDQGARVLDLSEQAEPRRDAQPANQ